MSRRDDGCFTIIGIVAFIIFSIVSAFKGEFIPLTIVLVIAIILWLMDSFEKIKYKKAQRKIEPQSNPNDEDNNSKVYLIIFIIIIGVIISLIFKESKNDYLQEQEKIKSIEPVEPIIIQDTLPKEKVVKEIVWFKKEFNNSEFELPENLKFDSSNSKEYTNIYIDYDLNLSLSVSANALDEENINRSIDEFSDKLPEYADAFNKNNKLNFDDFKLINYEMSKIGNAKAIKIEQSSKKVSGIKNIEMKVVSYNLISKPYYYDITYTFPKDSIKYDTIFKKIEKSFIFNGQN